MVENHLAVPWGSGEGSEGAIVVSGASPAREICILHADASFLTLWEVSP